MNPQMTRRSYFGAAVFFACLAILVFLGMVTFGWFNPTAPPTIGAGAITADSAGNVGVGIAPTVKFDVNGATKFRGLIDAFSNRIMNLAAPTVGTDAVNKDYVDSQTGGQNSQRVWGEGRPGSAVANVNGECGGGVAGIKVSRSIHTADWDGSAAVCPANWWVCTVTERGTAACGSTVDVNYLACNYDGASPTTAAPRFWLTNAGTTFRYGLTSDASGGSPINRFVCENRQVWCCANQ